jgi:O-antigen ligase/polysaccharide polymerase Wzy-like membrane protein
VTTPLQRAAAALDAPFAIGALAVVVFAVLLAKDAGYAPATWYTGGLFLVALAVVALLAYGRVSVSRPALAAIVLLGAFAAWSALTIVWSPDRGIAWDGANRMLLYFVVYAMFVALPWRRASIPVLLVSLSLAALGIGLVDLARSIGNTTDFFIIGRFAAPAGYANAACAVFMFAFWPLAYIAARREPPAVVRGLLLACGTALAELAVLTQSRGSLVAIPVAVVAYLLIVPRRLRAACALLVVALATFFARNTLLDVFDPVRLGRSDADDAIRAALVAIAVSATAVFIVWTVVAVLDGRLELSARALRLANTAGLVVVAVAVVVGVFAVSRVDLGASWRHFKAGYPEESGGSHFSIGLGSNRYDFWRVAVDEFRDHPLRGVGADNFAEDYIRERRSTEEPLYPHSLALRLPAQTGIVGTLLFVGFVLCAGFAVTRGSAFADGAARAGAAAAVYYAIHGSGDWLWEFAGLGAPAFAWLGLAGSRPVPAIGRQLPLRVGLAVAAAIVGLSFVFPWLAELDVRRAIRSWGSDPAAAYSDLRHARDLNPLSARADLLEGAIASRRNDLPRMAAAFRRAVDRNDRDWYAHFELALADAGLRRWGVALAELGRASRLNPREETIRLVRSEVAAKRPIDRDQIDRLFVERVRTRVGP